ncbi:hypothetical protein JTB14_016207 [Gonioctena quinquepunctata]|nr:hypothetical protein JTB14_016207 [Gonioctena quinquepunctata]
MKMRIERENNVIIFGMSETSSTNDPIKTVLKKITSPDELNVKSIIRLGESHGSWDRPVKVEFFNKNDALAVIRNKSKVSSTFPNVETKMDRTPKQLEEIKITVQGTQRTENPRRICRYKVQKQHASDFPSIW